MLTAHPRDGGRRLYLEPRDGTGDAWPAYAVGRSREVTPITEGVLYGPNRHLVTNRTGITSAPERIQEMLPGIEEFLVDLLRQRPGDRSNTHRLGATCRDSGYHAVTGMPCPYSPLESQRCIS